MTIAKIKMEAKMALKKDFEKGFTLVEVLVVLAILGIISVIVTLNVANVLKRQRLEAAAQQFQSFVESAANYARERSRGVFVVLHQAQVNGSNWWFCYLIEDTNGNDQLDYAFSNNPNAVPPGNGYDTFIQAEKVGLEGGMSLPQDIVLHTPTGQPNAIPVLGNDANDGWPGFNNWPIFNQTDYYLLCDPRGYTFNPISGTQMAYSTAISLTHIEMAQNQLRGMRFDISISPIWHTKLDKVMY